MNTKEPLYGYKTTPCNITIGKKVDLDQEEMIVDLGCGNDPERWQEDTIKVDHNVLDDEVITADYIHDELPFEEGSIDEFKMCFSLRQNLVNDKVLPHVLMKLAYYLKKGGYITIVDYCEIFDKQAEDESFIDVDYETFCTTVNFPRTHMTRPNHLHGLKLLTEKHNDNGAFITFLWVMRKTN